MLDSWKGVCIAMKLVVQTLNEHFSIGKLHDFSQVDLSGGLCFLGDTDEEKSLICPTEYVPDNVLVRDDGWRGMRIAGVLDFSLIGVLAEISTLLAQQQIGIFVVSTYNTDYIFVKEEHLTRATDTLTSAGFAVCPDSSPKAKPSIS